MKKRIFILSLLSLLLLSAIGFADNSVVSNFCISDYNCGVGFNCIQNVCVRNNTVEHNYTIVSTNSIVNWSNTKIATQDINNKIDTYLADVSERDDGRVVIAVAADSIKKNVTNFFSGNYLFVILALILIIIAIVMVYKERKKKAFSN
jgi:hypothetical protein